MPTTKVCTISPTSPLTSIKETITIDGYSRHGAAANSSNTNAKLTIELNGANAGAFAFGLAVGGANAEGTTIKGLVINRFGNVGVFVNAGSWWDGQFGVVAGGVTCRYRGRYPARRSRLPDGHGLLRPRPCSRFSRPRCRRRPSGSGSR